MAYQREVIADFIKKAKLSLSPKEIAIALGYPQSSVRRVVSELTKKGILERPERGFYKIAGSTVKDFYFHKTTGAAYCGGKRKYFDVFTWSHRNIDLDIPLAKRFVEETDDYCGNQSTSGYMKRISEDEAEVWFPEIVVEPI